MRTPAQLTAENIRSKRTGVRYRLSTKIVYALAGLFLVLAIVGALLGSGLLVHHAQAHLASGGADSRCRCESVDEVCSSTQPLVCVECNADTDCRGGTRCVNHRCEIPCGTSGDCPDDKGLCSGGVCVECGQDSDCLGNRNGGVCFQSRCVQCIADSDCSAGESCSTQEHACMQQCGPDGGCPTGLTCQTLRNASASAGMPHNVCVECLTSADCTGSMRPFCCTSGQNCGSQLYRCVQCVSDSACGLGGGATRWCGLGEQGCTGSSPNTSPIYPGICDPQTKVCHGAYCHLPCPDIETVFLLRLDREANDCVQLLPGDQGTACQDDPDAPVSGDARGCARPQACEYGNASLYWVFWRPRSAAHVDGVVLSHTYWVDRPSTASDGAFAAFWHLVQPEDARSPGTFQRGVSSPAPNTPNVVPSNFAPITIEPNDASQPTGFYIRTMALSGKTVYLNATTGSTNLRWQEATPGRAFVAEQISRASSASKGCAQGKPPQCPPKPTLPSTS